MSAFSAVVRAELFKVLRKRRGYILAGLWWVVLPLLTLLLARTLQNNLGGSFVDEDLVVRNVVQALGSPFGLARVHLVAPALLSPTFYIISVALFAGLLLGDERSHNMWKTFLTVQPQRLSVLAGKFVVAFILLGVLTLGALVFGILFGLVGMLFLDTDMTGQWASLVQMYALQWVFGLAAIAFAFLMIFLVRNVSLGIVLVFFLPALIEGIYSVVRATMGVRPLTRFNAFFQALELQVTFESLPRYFFSSNLYAPARSLLGGLITLIAGPMSTDELRREMGDDNPFANLVFGSELTLAHSGTVLAVYTVIFLGILTWLFLRRDFD